MMSYIWEEDAVEQQRTFQEQYSTWKEYPRNFTGYLKTHIAIMLFGKVEKADPNTPLMQYHECYNKKQRENISIVFNKIMNLFPDSGFIQFNCTFLTLKLPKESPFIYVIFRCRSPKNLSQIYFIEPSGRVYKNWSDFVQNNKLPKCEYITVQTGVYSVDGPKMKFKSPAACRGIISKSLDWAFTAATIGSLTAGVFAVAPVTAACAGVCAGIYGAGTSVLAIKDRVEHRESVGLNNKESILHYANITASSLTGVGSLAVANAGRISNFFGSYSKFAMGTIKVVNYTTLIFDGAFFAVNAHDFWEKCKEKRVEAQDVFNLSLQIFLFYGAVMNVRDMHKCLSEIQQSPLATNNLNVSNKKLTKTQKRNLRKRRAKARSRQLETGPNAVQITESDTYASIKKFAYSGGLIAIQFLLKHCPRAEVIIDEFNEIRNLISAHLASRIGLAELIYGFSQHLGNLQIILKEDLSRIRSFLAQHFPSVPNNDEVAQIINNEVDKIKQISEDICTASVQNSSADNESLVNNSEDTNDWELVNVNRRKPSNYKIILEAAKCLTLNCEIPENGTMVVRAYRNAVTFVINEVETFFQKYDLLLAKNTAIIGEEKAKQMLLVLGMKNESDFFPNKQIFDEQVMKASEKTDEFLHSNSDIRCKSDNLSTFVCEIVGSLLTMVDDLFKNTVPDNDEIGLQQLMATLKLVSITLLDELTVKMETAVRTRDALFRENAEILGEEYTNQMLKSIGVPTRESEIFKFALTQLDECKNDIVLLVMQRSYTPAGLSSRNDGLETNRTNAEVNPAETNIGHIIFTTACEKFYRKIVTQTDEPTERDQVFKQVAGFVAKKIVEELDSFKDKCAQLKENNIDVVGPRVFRAMLKNVISIDKSLLVKEFSEKLDNDDALILEFFKYSNSVCDSDLKNLELWDNTIREEGFGAYRVECCGDEEDRYYLDFASNLFKMSFDCATVDRNGNFIFIKSRDAAVTFRFSTEDTNTAIVIIVDLNKKDDVEEESPSNESAMHGDFQMDISM